MIIRLVPRVGVPNYPIAENLGPVEICVEVLQGSLAPGQTATVQFATDNPTRKFFCVSQTNLMTIVGFTIKVFGHLEL